MGRGSGLNSRRMLGGGGGGGVFWQWNRERRLGTRQILGLCDYIFMLPVTLLAFLDRHAVYIVFGD